MIGKVSIVVVPSSVVSLSCANAAGVAIGGASDITGNAGTIIVGSYRTVRVGNCHLRAAEWREREALWRPVVCGRQYGKYS